MAQIILASGTGTKWSFPPACSHISLIAVLSPTRQCWSPHSLAELLLFKHLQKLTWDARRPFYSLCACLPLQVPYLWTADARHSPPAVRVKSWTWRGTCIWADCQRTELASFSPRNSGLPCSTTATWAAFVTCSLMGAARTSGSWRRCRMQQASSPPVHAWAPNSVTATPARTMQCARTAGTASSATALGLATGEEPVKEVSGISRSEWSVPWSEDTFAHLVVFCFQTTVLGSAVCGYHPF